MAKRDLTPQEAESQIRELAIWRAWSLGNTDGWWEARIGGSATILFPSRFKARGRTRRSCLAKLKKEVGRQ